MIPASLNETHDTCRQHLLVRDAEQNHGSGRSVSEVVESLRSAVSLALPSVPTRSRLVRDAPFISSSRALLLIWDWPFSTATVPFEASSICHSAYAFIRGIAR